MERGPDAAGTWQAARVLEVVLLNGTVGAGKTTTAHAVSAALSAAGTRHAVIDVDQVRLLWPPPDRDPFQHEVAVANLASLARNYERAGAERLVLAGVLEDAQQLADYRRVLGAGMRHVLLTVQPEVAARRLRARHADDAEGRAWHLRRTGELAAVLRGLQRLDAVIDTSELTPPEVAAQVLAVLER